MNSQDSQIEVNGLWKVFGDQPERAVGQEHSAKSRAEIQDEMGLVVALRNVSFSVPPGEVFVVMGLSGSGKSTLVRCLTRLIEATQGKVLFDGEDILEYTPEQMIDFRRHKVAMVFQHYGLLPHRRVLDNVAYGLEIQGVDKDSRYRVAREVIETVGLGGWEDYFPREMSGGMQQRVGLARALAVDADVLLMDEPFSGLDPLIRREMQDELISLETELNKTIVFITHDLNEALKIGDRIAIMRDGEIVQQGSPEEIVSAPADDYVSEFVQDVSKAKVIQARAIMEEPSAVVHEQQGPQEALDVMRSCNTDRVFLLGHDHELRGTLTRDRAEALAQQNNESLEGIPTDRVVTASRGSYIEDIIPMAAQTEQPIAIVDEDGHLVGEVRRGTLLAGMAERGLSDVNADVGQEAG